jgi:hypothetical protein
MFWRKKPKEGRLVPHRKALNEMTVALLAASGTSFDAASQLEQALVGTFVFGMIHAHSMTSQLSPPDTHALALLVFQDTLHYTPAAAAEAVQQCINATAPGYHDGMNAILHRGIEGHRQYVEAKHEAMASNLFEVLSHYQRRDA